MATYTLSDIPKDIVLGASGVLMRLQNCRTILTTRKGTVPLNREFGLPLDALDSPINEARARLEPAIFKQMKRWEPDVMVKKLNFMVSAMEGKISVDIGLKESD